MQIIIDISKELKNEIHHHGLSLCPNDKTALINAIKNGVPQETVTEFADRCRECGAKYGKLLKSQTTKIIFAFGA